MDEVFPVLAGVALGLVVHHIGSRLRIVLLAALGLAFGVVTSWVSGELAISWVYILIDTAQVLSAAVLTATLVVAWQRRAAWYRPRS